MKRWIALLALAAVVCGAAPGVAAAATATTRTAHVNAAQLSLAYPKAWTVVPYKRKEMLAQRKALAKRKGLPRVWLTVVVTDHAARSLSSRHGGETKASS